MGPIYEIHEYKSVHLFVAFCYTKLEKHPVQPDTHKRMIPVTSIRLSLQFINKTLGSDRYSVLADTQSPGTRIGIRTEKDRLVHP